MAVHNIVYFLGAGSSKNFGYPLTGEIMPLIIEKLRKASLFELKKNSKTSIEKKYEKELLDFLYTLYPGLKEVHPSNKKHHSNIPGIVEVLSLVDHFCFYNVPPHPAITDGKLTRFRDLLNRAVSELIVDFDIRFDPANINGDMKKMYDSFIAPIAREKKNGKVSIITTNYDLLIDWQFTDVLQQNKVDYGISYRDINTNQIVHRHPQPLFHYYKLHGSLNWLRCDLCGQYYINPYGSIVGLAFQERATANNTCICSDSLRLKSVLVAPSLVRDIRDSNLLQIWKAALEAIRTADRIIFIGYSLPAEDLAIKSIVMRALNGRDKSPAPEVHVVQYGTAAKPNYENIFGKGIKYYSKGLQEYIKKTNSAQV